MVGSESVLKKIVRGFKSKKSPYFSVIPKTNPDICPSSVTIPMELVPPPKEMLEKILLDINLNTEQHKRDTQTLKAWLHTQPHLPHDLDDQLLSAFIVGCKNNLEHTKQCLDGYLSNRTSYPDFYQHRDPCDPAFRKASSVTQYSVLPQMTPEGYRVSILSMASPDVTAADFDMRLNAIKVLCSYDTRFLEEQFWAGDIVIGDWRNSSLSLVPAVVPVIKSYVHCVTSSLPVRFKKIIFINVSPFADIVITMMKLFMKQKLVQRVITTTEDHTFLYNHVPRDMLPEEYGGKAGTLQYLNDAWQLKVESYRDWFLKDMKRKVDESLRPEKSKYKSKEIFGVPGTFKKLAID